MMRRLLLLALALLPLAPSQDLSSLPAFIEREMKEWKVPGLALAIVKDDRVIHLRGYGVRLGEAKLPVTEQTLFGIGSVTKSMTVTVLQSLVEEGKLDLDRPVRDYAPDFRLSDPVITGQVTVRDLLTHRTGLPRHDALWFRSPLSRAELFSRLRYLEFSAGLRQKYQYNNLMYMSAGVVAERIAGQSWEELVRTRVFIPTGLRTANTSVSRAGDYGVDKQTNLDAVGPAGSVNANITEFARYLRLHINAGTIDGTRVISELRAREMQLPQMPIMEPVYEEFGDQSYGMGFFIGQYAGRKVVFHTGTIGRNHALLAFLPQERVGLVMLLNHVEHSFPKVVSAHVFDLLLNRPPQDWGARYRDLRKKQDAERKTPKPVEGTAPFVDEQSMSGAYQHPAYGTVTISAGQKFSWLGLQAPLEHYHYDVYQLKQEGGEVGDIKVQFHRAFDGRVDGLLIPLEPSVAPIFFRRQDIIKK